LPLDKLFKRCIIQVEHKIKNSVKARSSIDTILGCAEEAASGSYTGRVKIKERRKKMEKLVKGLMLVVLVAALLISVAAEAQEWGRYPTQDAWRMAGERNGYDHGYRDGYYGYPLAHLERYAPEYRDGYRLGYRDGVSDGAYRHERGGHGNGGYGYPQSQPPTVRFKVWSKDKGWGISLPVPPIWR